MMGNGDNDYYSQKQALRACPFLLLDELEIGIGSEYTRNELYDLLYWRQMARLPTVVSSPSEMNQLLRDHSGWRRLAQLFMIPDFCSEIRVGEDSPNEDAQGIMPAPAATQRSTRGRRKPG
jgi:DNA replication protein DnaC